MPTSPTLIGIGVNHPSGKFSLYVELEPNLVRPEAGVVQITAENVLDSSEWYEFDPLGLVDPTEGPMHGLARLSLPKGKVWYLTVRSLSGEEMERTVKT